MAKSFHECATGIRELALAAATDYEDQLIDYFALTIYGDDKSYHKGRGSDLTQLWINQHFDDIYEHRKHKAIAYYIDVLDGLGVVSGGDSNVTVLMDQIKREVIIRNLNRNAVTAYAVKRRMQEMAKEWD